MELWSNEADGPTKPMPHSILRCPDAVRPVGMQAKLTEASTTLVAAQTILAQLKDAVLAKAVSVAEMHHRSVIYGLTRGAASHARQLIVKEYGPAIGVAT